LSYSEKIIGGEERRKMDNSEEKQPLQITEAAKVEFVKYLEEKEERGQYIRVGVIAGGCSGYRYLLEDGTLEEGDHVIPIDESRKAVLVDPKSFIFLQNVVLDYREGLMGSGFKFINQSASRCCGCGESFSCG